MICRRDPLRRLSAALIPLLLLGCSAATDNTLPGTLEWDRVAVLAEASREVTELLVQEGAQVQAGQLLMRLDSREADAQLAQAEGEAARLAALLEELRRGTRRETIAAQRAELARAQSDAVNLQRTRDRAAELRQQGLNTPAELESAETALQMAQANVRALQARLDELRHGPRAEELAQAEAALESARANASLLKLRRERLDVKAPRAGRVDALPFRLGDQPPQGAALVSLLVGEAPYARVYVPERLRAAVAPGDHYRVHVDGVEQPFDAVVRSVRSESSFTPYYALTGDDASRLVYRAELLLGASARTLPAGIPCHAERTAHE
ncbi:MAG TPA: biotin/lipoyl-binding protein [Gammaproteobacteria bacterium]